MAGMVGARNEQVRDGAEKQEGGARWGREEARGWGEGDNAEGRDGRPLVQVPMAKNLQGVLPWVALRLWGCGSVQVWGWRAGLLGRLPSRQAAKQPSFGKLKLSCDVIVVNDLSHQAIVFE